MRSVLASDRSDLAGPSHRESSDTVDFGGQNLCAPQSISTLQYSTWSYNILARAIPSFAKSSRPLDVSRLRNSYGQQTATTTVTIEESNSRGGMETTKIN